MQQTTVFALISLAVALVAVFLYDSNTTTVPFFNKTPPPPPSSTLETNMGNTHRSGKDSPEAAKLVQDAISTYPVVIFSKSYCPYCSSAKRDIANAGRDVAGFQSPKVFELNTMGSLGSAIQRYLAQSTGRYTVPNVFIGGTTVGGGDDVSGYAHRGVLKQMLSQAGPRIAAADTSKARELVEEAIENNPVVVFSKTTCPYCRAAKAALSDVSTRVKKFEGAKVVEVNTMGELGAQVQAYLVEKTGRGTVPNVFISGKSIGGADEVRAYAAAGELDGMVSAAIGIEGAASPPTPETIVEDAIANNAVAVFSKSYCPYCMRAKGLLATTVQSIKGAQAPKVLELDETADGEAIQQYLMVKTGQRTVPNIFIGGKHIGGSDALAGAARRNELVGLITDAQAALPAEPENSTTATEETEVLAESVTAAETAAAATAATDAPAATETAPPKPAVKEIVFGAGCFWGVELAFQRVVGVVKTEVGYSNGKIARVAYDAICTGLTGAAEVVRVWYDPSVISLGELLKIWESRHDPTSLNKQGNDSGTQYRSAVYYNDQEQADEIAKWRADASQRLGKSIVTEVSPVENYSEAEEYHQRYLEKKGQSAGKGATARIRCYG